MKNFRWMMGVAVGLVLAQTGMAATPSGPFKISALKKTVAKDKSETQKLPRGTTCMEEKKIVYQFEIQNQSTAHSQQDLKVRWVVMMEGAEGRSYQDAPGEKTVTLPFGRPVQLETAPVSVAERTWRGMAGRTAEMSQVVEGYGLQILTLEGEVLAEKYEPDSLKGDIQWEAPLPPAGFDRGARSPWPRRPVPMRPNQPDLIPSPAP